MDSVICIDALMLAALQSPTALRCCLSQREPVSLTCVEHWLRMDLFAAMPIFTTIHRMMLSVYATGDSRLPYELPGAAMDFNLFFTASYLNHRIPAYPKLHINSTPFDQRTTNDKEEVSFAGERRCIETMEAMLKVRTLPSRRILLRHLSSVVGIRLLLWLLLEIPKELLLAWGSNSSTGVDAILNSHFNPANKGGLDAPHNEEDEEEEDEEEEDEERTKKTAPGVAAAIAAFLQRTPHEDGPRFVLSPFLLAVVVEIRRRIKREAEGNSPSEFTLVECVGHVLPQRVEDGRPRKDPLVSESFSLLPESTAGASEGLATQPRMQKLYQSDLVMLLLVVTSTPTRRSLPCSERGSRRGSVLVRPGIHTFIGLSDGHHELFEYLLRKKAEKVRTSKETMESGYFRLLYLCLLRFKNLSSLKILLSMTPLFAVLGPHDRSPFGDLVYAWTLDRDLIIRNHLELFLDTFWNELYYRTLEKQYDEATIAKGRALLLLDKMMERRKAYSSTLQQMWTSAHSPSRVALIKPHPRNLAVGDVASFLQKTLETPTWSSPHRAVAGNVSLSEYSDECLQAEEHVRLTFESLALAPRTYLTPETLYIALFSGPQQNLILLRYLMIRCRVVTVCANPLKEVAVPAMEYALRVGNIGAIESLLTIGVTLHDYIDDGNLAEDMFLCEAVPPNKVAPLLGIWKQKEEQRRINPLVSYGIIRTVQSAS
ncbi:hypothetical protein TCDM_01088 [Trypanosoma cruzi Dm28c]|uniref:Uncharacterized protein n=1 Tax=Trypanosoma cruzi Dm28c TaxID=1416333 RepID=V5BUU7_TRYCR|nr:hypothetical protein TCDM_01088 [Trypanosoma cruzi Dm28c]